LSVEGTEGVWSAPPQKIFGVASIKKVSFYAFPVIFTDTVTFEKVHPNQKGGCPDTLDTRLDPRPGVTGNNSAGCPARWPYLALDGRCPIAGHNLEGDAAAHIPLTTHNSHSLPTNSRQSH